MGGYFTILNEGYLGLGLAETVTLSPGREGIALTDLIPSKCPQNRAHTANDKERIYTGDQMLEQNMCIPQVGHTKQHKIYFVFMFNNALQNIYKCIIIMTFPANTTLKTVVYPMRACNV